MMESSWSATLLPQLEHHLRWLTRATEGLDAGQACYQIGDGRPSIAWIVGHLTAGADSLAEAVAAMDPALSAEFHGNHGEPHWAVDSQSAWEAHLQRWSTVSERSLGGLQALDEADFARPPAIEILPEFQHRLATRHAFLAGEIFHFAYHLGQVGTLRAAQELGWT